MTDKALIEAVPFHFTQADLRKLGMDAVAYVRKYRVRGQVAYVVHAADGTAIAMQNNATAARNSARGHDLELVSLH